MHIGAVVDESV